MLKYSQEPPEERDEGLVPVVPAAPAVLSAPPAPLVSKFSADEMSVIETMVPDVEPDLEAVLPTFSEDFDLCPGEWCLPAEPEEEEVDEEDEEAFYLSTSPFSTAKSMSEMEEDPEDSKLFGDERMELDFDSCHCYERLVRCEYFGFGFW